MKKLKLAAAIIGILVGVAAAVPANQISAQSPTEEAKKGVNAIGGNEDGNERTLMSRMESLINTFLYVVGAVAVLVVTYGGFKYMVSRGEASEVSSAKNTIIYAGVGLIIAISSYAIINFVIDQFAADPPRSSIPGRGPEP